MPVTNELSDSDLGIKWGSDRSNVLSDEQVGVSWKSGGIPEVLSENPDEVPSVGRPERLSDQEWERLRKKSALQSERGLGAIEGELTGRTEQSISRLVDPTIPPELIETGLALSTPVLNRVPGVRKSIAETTAGLTSPVNLAMAAGGGAATSIPRIGGAVARGIAGGFAADIASNIPEQAREAGRISVEGTPEQQQRALSDLSLSILMASAAGGGALRPGAAPPAEPPITVTPEFQAADLAARQRMEPTPLAEQPPGNEIAHKLPPGSIPPEMIQADPSMRRFANVDVNDLQILPSAEETALAAAREAELRGRQTLPQGGEPFADPLAATQTGRTAEMTLLQRSAEGSERGNETIPENPLFQEQPQAEPPLPEVYRKPFAEGPGVPTQNQLLEERLGRRDMLETVKALGETPASITPKIIDELRGRPQTSVRPHAEEILFKTIIDKLEQERLGPKYQPPTDLPPEVRAAQAKAVDDANAIGLTRSAAAATEAIGKEHQNASRVAETKSVPEPTLRPRLGEETPLRQSGEAADVRPREQVNEPATPQPEERARSAPEQKPEVPLTEKAQSVQEIIASIDKLPTEEAGILKQKPAVEAGMKLSEADVPALEKARDASMKEAMDAAEKGDNETFKAAFGRNIWFSGAIEGARRKGPNFEQVLRESGKAAPKEGEINAQKEKEVPQGNVLKQSPTKAAKQFRDLVKEFGVQLGFVTRPDAIADLTVTTKTGHGTGSIKAKVARDAEFQKATRRALKELGGDASRQDNAQLAELLPKLQERIAEWEREQAKPAPAPEVPPPEVPKLGVGEKGTGDLFKGEDQPFNLAGEKGVDTARIEAERQAAETRAKEAADLAAKQQPELPTGEAPKSMELSPQEQAELDNWSARAKEIANKLRDQFKTPDTGKELGTFGVVPKVINAAVEIAAKAIEAGGTIADGIAKAIEHIRSNHEGVFNERAFTKMLQAKYEEVAATVPPPPPIPPRAGPAAAPSAPTPPPTPPVLPATTAAGTVMRRLRAIRDYMTVDPIPRLTREMGAGAQTAFEHAKARGAVPPMINNLLAKVFPEQYHDPAAMARTMDILKKDDILGGYDDFRAREAEATAKGDARDAARWKGLADRIGSAHDMEQLAADVEAARGNKTISDNINRWKEFVNPELDQLYNEMKGVDPNTPREGRGRVFGARVNLLPKFEEAKWMNALTGDEGTALPQQNASNYRNPNARRDKFDRVAKLTGDYSDNPAAILANVLFHRWNEVTKVRFYNELVKSGTGSWEAPADGMIKGEPAARLAVKVPETNEAGVTRQVEKAMWVPERLVSEIRGILSTDLNLKSNPVGDALNKLQLYQMADFVAHTKNQVSSVANSPQMKGVFSELARRFPGLNVADAVGRIGHAAFEVSHDTPAIREEIAWMAKRGLLREKSLYKEPSKLWKPLHYTHEFLYRNDVAMRLVMNRFYNTLVKIKWAPDNLVERRKFVSQAGEYNSRLIGPLMRAARSSGIAPFIVAGRNFNRFAIRRITGNPGFKPTNVGASVALRGLNAYTLAATLAVPMILNYFTTGRVTGRPGTPLGAFDLGKEKDERGNFPIFDWAQLIGIRRGARITGLDAIAEGTIAGRDADEILGKMRSQAVQAVAHPWVGPAVGFTWQALTGKRLDMRGGTQPAEARNMGSPLSISQDLENLRVAVKNQNRPLYGAVIRPAIGDTEEGYFKDLLGDIRTSPMSAAGAKKAVSPALEEARMLSITGTPATVESVERAKLKRKLAKAMMAGDDKPTQDAIDAGLISKRDATELEDKTTQDPITYLVHRHLSTDQAMRVWHLATPEEKKELFDVVTDKINRDQKSSEEKLNKWVEELNKFQAR